MTRVMILQYLLSLYCMLHDGERFIDKRYALQNTCLFYKYTMYSFTVVHRSKRYDERILSKDITPPPLFRVEEEKNGRRTAPGKRLGLLDMQDIVHDRVLYLLSVVTL
jgi:hypothetical protein